MFGKATIQLHYQYVLILYYILLVILYILLCTYVHCFR